MNAALEILSFIKFSKAIFPYGTHTYHIVLQRIKKKKSYGRKSFCSSLTANVNLFLANAIG